MTSHLIFATAFFFIMLFVFWVSWRLSKNNLQEKNQFFNRLDQIDQMTAQQAHESLSSTNTGWQVLSPATLNTKSSNQTLLDLGIKNVDKVNQPFCNDISPEEAYEDTSSKFVDSSSESKKNDLIVITLLARSGEVFAGYELLQTLLASGMRFGAMSIFHRYAETEPNIILFSLASATEPGIFDMNKMGAIECKGLTLFMRLTSPLQDENCLQVFLETANFISEELNAIVADEKRNPLSEEAIQIFEQQVATHQRQLV